MFYFAVVDSNTTRMCVSFKEGPNYINSIGYNVIPTLFHTELEVNLIIKWEQAYGHHPLKHELSIAKIDVNKLP